MLTFFYATREKHPTFRVDLTELFSSELAGKGHRIDWHMPSMKPAPSSVLRLNDNERVFVGKAYSGNNLLSKLANHAAGLFHDLGIYRLACKNRYDFIQVRDKMFAGLVGLIVARRRGIPFFYWMSFPYPEADIFRSRDRQLDLSFLLRTFYRLRGTLTGWLLYHIVLPGADHIFVQSDQMKKEVADRGIATKNMTPMPMCISLRQVENIKLPSISAPGLEGRLPLIYVGTMVRVRRIDFLIETLKLVRNKIPEVILVLVGDASKDDMQFLRDEAIRLGVSEHVLFTGFVPMEKAWAYIKLAKVCLSPIRPSLILDVGTPTKIIEYIVFGRPVVANNHPDQSKVIGESGAGHAVDYRPEAFADAIVDILGNPDKGEAMGRAGIEYVKQHRSYEALSSQLEEKYLKLVNSYNSSKLAREKS